MRPVRELLREVVAHGAHRLCEERRHVGANTGTGGRDGKVQLQRACELAEARFSGFGKARLGGGVLHQSKANPAQKQAHRWRSERERGAGAGVEVQG